MTQAEWNAHSEDWRKGWNDYTNCRTMDMSKEEFDSKSEEWKMGAEYAYLHPFGFVAIPM